MDGQRLATHWDGCWQEHLECAIQHINELEVTVTSLSMQLMWANNLLKMRQESENRVHKELLDFLEETHDYG